MIGSKEWRKTCLQMGLTDEFLDSFLQKQIEQEESDRLRTEQAKIKALEIARMLKDKYLTEKVFLYGSLAWGGFGKHSDIDVFMVGFKGNYWKAWGEVENIACPFDFDLVCEEDALPSLRDRIHKEGVEL
jgi:predicted nucleotidyltransferase